MRCRFRFNPEIEPYDLGMLDVGDGNAIYWETRGTPQGKTAVVLHGGPGSGCSPWFRRLFDPDAYRIVLFDQRNYGRSIPHASDPQTDLASNTPAHLVADIERVRERLGIDRWLILGGSWGSTLALAYGVTHPEQVSEIILFGVTTGRHAEFDWTFRGGLSQFFPEQWERLSSSVPNPERDGDVVEVYYRLLNDPDPRVGRTGRASGEIPGRWPRRRSRSCLTRRGGSGVASLASPPAGSCRVARLPRCRDFRCSRVAADRLKKDASRMNERTQSPDVT